MTTSENQLPSKRVAVVTGAGSGIGRDASLSLLGDGFDVVLSGRRQEALEETAELASGLAGQTHIVSADVSDPDDVTRLFEETAAAFGRLDFLFNNAGNFGTRSLLEDVSYEEWRTTLDTNLTGAFLCTQAAFKTMKSQQPMGGRIVNNGSISAHAPRPNAVGYTASKHGMTGLTKQAALDGRKYDIACGQIDIGNAAVRDHGLPDEAHMNVKHVGEAILYMANLPLGANVLFMTIMATKMPFVGRG
jgi:NAD(P)-dependent dehydrogenase (short-subunit alcohol dehydrogenase family)